MSEDKVRELASKILHNQLFSDWPLYLFMLAIVIVGNLVSNFLSSYGKKRGEALATKADFAQLLKQVEQTTSVTEEIKSKVNHADWATREFKVLKHIKLEELIQAIHEAEDWIDAFRNHKLFDESDPGTCLIPKISRLVVLYFPELDDRIRDYKLAYSEMISAILDTKKKILEDINNPAAQHNHRQEYTNQWGVNYENLIQRRNQVEEKARRLMDELISQG